MQWGGRERERGKEVAALGVERERMREREEECQRRGGDKERGSTGSG